MKKLAWGAFDNLYMVFLMLGAFISADVGRRIAWQWALAAIGCDYGFAYSLAMWCGVVIIGGMVAFQYLAAVCLFVALLLKLIRFICGGGKNA